MDRLIGYLAIGVTEGLLYGLLAMGLVLIYKGSRILNFAQTSFALVSAFFAWWFTAHAGFLPFAAGSRPRYAIAVVLALGLAALNGYGVEHGVIRRLQGAPRLVLLVATLAVSSGNAGLVLLLFGRTSEQQSEGKSLPSFITASFTIGTKLVKGADIEVLVAVPLVCAGLALFFTRTRYGVAVRAAAENGDAARLLGISTARVSAFTWVTGSLLAAVAGLLITEHRGSLDIASLSTGFLLVGLISALVGGLTSLPGALVGGLVVGVLQALAGYLFGGTPGADAAVLVGLVVVILVFRPQGLFGGREGTEDRAAFVQVLRPLPLALRSTVPARGTYAVLAMGVAFALAASVVVGPRTNTVLAEAACYAIVCVSLTVLLGYAGQISLGQWGLTGFGGYMMAVVTHTVGIPWLLGIVYAVVFSTILAVLLGLPALRIRGLYLAVATMAFHVFAVRFLFNQVARRFGGGSGGTAGIPVDKPKLGPFDLDAPSGRWLTMVCIIGFLLAGLVATNLLRSRTGRTLLAVRENEKAAATLGISLPTAKLVAFAVSGGLAGLAGALEVTVLGQAQPAAWDLEISFNLVSMVVIGGLGSVPGAAFGSFLVFALPRLLTGVNQWFVLLGTGALLFVVITRVPGGIAGLVQRIRDRLVAAVATLDPETARRLAAGAAPAGAAGSVGAVGSGAEPQAG